MIFVRLLAVDSATKTTGIDQLLTPLGSVIVLAIGAFIGWLGATVKVRSEIKKLNAEVGKLKEESITEAGKTLKSIQDCRQKYVESAANCGSAATATAQAIIAGDEELAKIRRQELCTSIGENAIPRFHDLVEWNHLSRKSDPILLGNFIEYQVVPELGRFAKWIRIVNAERFAKMGLVPYEVSIQTAQPFLDVLSGLCESDRARLEPLVAETIAGMRNQRVR